MKTIILIIVIIMAQTVAAQSDHKFKFIKLGKILKERASKIKERSNQLQLKNSIIDNLKKFYSPAEIGDENSPIFQELENFLKGKYENLANNNVQTLLEYNNSFNLGQKNFSGLNWEKPMGYYNIGVNRQLAPDLFDDVRWIVTDTFVISIDATTYLNKLKEEEMIDMSKNEIMAFAGMSFQRVYKYEHFANSFWEGISSDFSKLFMSFLKFRKQNIINMAPYEYISKEDFLSFNAGIGGSFNYYCLAFSAGVLAKLERVAKITIQSLGPDDNPENSEFLRLSIQKSKSTAAGITLGMQLDLLELLKIHLFSYDFEYELKKTQATHLSFYEKDKPSLIDDSPKGKEFHKLLKLRIFDVKELIDNVVTLEERTNRKSKSKVKLFHYGNLHKKDHELVNFINDGTMTTFMKHNFYIENYQQNVISKLLGGVVGTLLNYNHTPKIQNKFIKNLSMEYQSNESQGGREPASVDKDSKELSLSLTQEFSTVKTVRKIKKLKDRKSKQRAISFINRYTSLDQEIVDAVKRDELRGPMSIKSTIEIEQQGLTHLNALSTDKAFSIFARDICNSKRPNRWSNNKYRKTYLKRPQIGRAEICTKQLGERFLSYKSTLDSNGKINIDKFKKFMEYLRRKADSRSDFEKIFGAPNIFIHGVFQANRPDGNQFQTNFRDGEFNGIGVIDNYIRENRL